SRLVPSCTLLPYTTLFRSQTELKRIHFSRQIKKGNFVTDEPEYKVLPNFIRKGDWVIDIGANVGHYTIQFSELVGKEGRVIAFRSEEHTSELQSRENLVCR